MTLICHLQLMCKMSLCVSADHHSKMHLDIEKLCECLNALSMNEDVNVVLNL